MLPTPGLDKLLYNHARQVWNSLWHSFCKGRAFGKVLVQSGRQLAILYGKLPKDIPKKAEHLILFNPDSGGQITGRFEIWAVDHNDRSSIRDI